MYKLISSNLIKLDATLGYLYFIDTDHPMANDRTGKVMLHRHLASIKEGRWLTYSEHVHHLDENKLNNAADNLQVLSASEHSKLHHPALDKAELMCPVCGCKFLVNSKTAKSRVTCSEVCGSIRSISSRKFEVTKAELESMIWNIPIIYIAKYYGVSDTSIRKRARLLGCTLPPPYFHNKTEECKALLREENNIPTCPHNGLLSR